MTGDQDIRNNRPALLSTMCRLTVVLCAGFLVWSLAKVVLKLPFYAPPGHSVLQTVLASNIAAILLLVSGLYMLVAYHWARRVWTLSILGGAAATLYMVQPVYPDLVSQHGSLIPYGMAVAGFLLVILLGTPYTSAARRFFKLGHECFVKTSSTSLLQVMLQRELLTLPRRKRFYLKRIGYIMLTAVVIGWQAASLSVQDTSVIGLKIFQTLSLVILVSMLIIPLYTSAAGIVREKEDQSLGLLMLSDIQAGQFMMGKMLNSFFSTMMIILSVLPLFILSVAFGGVSAGQITAAFAIVLSTVFLGTCLGLFIASVVQTERTMGSLVILSGLNLYLFLPLVIIWICIPNAIDYDWILNMVSPVVAMTELIGGNNSIESVPTCLFSLILGIPFLYAAYHFLPRSVFMKDPVTEEERMHQKAGEDPALKQALQKPDIGDGNPVAWRDLNVAYGGMKASWVRFLITCVILAVVTGAIMMTARSGPREILVGAPTVISVFSAGVFLLALVSYCSRAFNREKKHRTLEILMTTTLTAKEIVWGKLKAILLTLSPWLITACLGLGMLSVVYLNTDTWHMLVFICLEYLCTCFLFSGLAMLISLRQQKEAGFSFSIAAFIAYFFVVRMPARELLDARFLLLIDVIIHLAIGTWLYRTVIRKFRNLGLRMI
jgi:ABC-type transport system involved in multi-copper enzyme maturation permease subunit